MNNNEERNRAIDLYHKLHKCLQIALTAPENANGDSLSVHANNIIRNIADLINSDYMFCNRTVDAWADYFLSMNGDKGYTAEEIESMRLTVCDLEAQLESLDSHPMPESYDRYYVTVTHNFSRTFEVLGRTREEGLTEAKKIYDLCTSGTYDMCEGDETWDWEVTAADPMQVIKDFDN